MRRRPRSTWNFLFLLIIKSNDFLLEIHRVSIDREEPGGPYLDWLNLRVTLSEKGIRAEGLWTAMPEELLRFKEELVLMNAGLSEGLRAELKSVERGFTLTLRMMNLGAVSGRWTFQPNPPDGACLTGICGLDQSYLLEIIRGIETLCNSSA